MPIDAAKALAAEPRSGEITWDRKDVQLYHLGLGAGVPATDPDELRYTLESKLHVLPSFATVAGAGSPERSAACPCPASTSASPASCTAARPSNCTARSRSRARPWPPGGSPPCTTRARRPSWSCAPRSPTPRTVVDERRPDLRTGRGRLGRRPRPSTRLEEPTGAPDRTVERQVREEQALLYRLSGDWNPLHADPEFAKLAGFDRPILHGLCTYGMTLKAVVDTLLGGDVARVRSHTTRFAGVVYPGRPCASVCGGGKAASGWP